ncbi:hypothetical protein [Streptomyces sp. NPDC016845]|uniref:hypothetical protein n=1 Tax=Streptomyces sp. NPDC016845 TaxID=3364972 RepID=UPI00378AF2F0
MTVRSKHTARTRALQTSTALALALTALLVTGCGTGDGDDSRPAAGTATPRPHGYVEGAKEAAEQQARLVLNEPGSGETRVLDLITGKVTRTGRTEGALRLGTDGRFGYLYTSRTTHVLDSGSWLVDHGDHVHYYRAAIRDIGELPGRDAAEVRSDAAVTAATGKDGRAVLYDRTALDQGSITSTRTLPGRYQGAVVPYSEHLVALTRTDEDKDDDKDKGKDKDKDTAGLVLLDRDGERLATPDGAHTCSQPQGDALTRRGVVFGCAEGALLVREKGGAFTAEMIPYPGKVPAAERATAFRHRSGSDTLTATAGPRAVWVLDVGERSWTRVRTGTVVAANTAGEGAPLLVLEGDGALHGYDITTGERTARTKQLVTPGRQARTGTERPVIEVDRSRAYVNDPDGRRVHEVDYNDALRVARSFDLDIDPVLMAETGR